MAYKNGLSKKAENCTVAVFQWVIIIAIIIFIFQSFIQPNIPKIESYLGHFDNGKVQ